MDLLNLIVVKGGWIFSILNVIMILVHLMLLRRSWQIADRFQVIHGLPYGMVALNMKVQRDGDKSAYRQVWVCIAICFFLIATTIVNISQYLSLFLAERY